MKIDATINRLLAFNEGQTKNERKLRNAILATNDRLKKLGRYIEACNKIIAQYQAQGGDKYSAKDIEELKRRLEDHIKNLGRLREEYKKLIDKLCRIGALYKALLTVDSLDRRVISAVYKPPPPQPQAGEGICSVVYRAISSQSL